jgi:hypothetical protein
MAELPKDVLTVSSAFPFYVSGRIRSFNSSLCKRINRKMNLAENQSVEFVI